MYSKIKQIKPSQSIKTRAEKSEGPTYELTDKQNFVGILRPSARRYDNHAIHQKNPPKGKFKWFLAQTSIRYPHTSLTVVKKWMFGNEFHWFP